MFTHIMWVINRGADASDYGLDDESDEWKGNPFESYIHTLYQWYLLTAIGEFDHDLYRGVAGNQVLLIVFLFAVVVVMMNVL